MLEVSSAAAIAGKIAAQGFSTLFSELAKKTFRPKDAADKQPDLPAARFLDHLTQTFERCTKIRTLISRDVSVNLLEQYVPVNFTHNLKEKVASYDDYEVIEAIREHKRATIVGTAGGGKTIFMRYLWVSYFIDPQGRIPIFLELRRLNELNAPDIMTFIFRNVITNDSEIKMDSFNKSIQEGRFMFIFDGFDEIGEDKRLNIEKQILDLSFHGKDNIIVVSGRPDSRFDAWQDFTKYRVKPLEKSQVIDLVHKVNFDQVIKNKFVIALNKGLYDKHSSFLSSPLLATMMLLTFQHYAEIPEKIHVFYDLAFDTLFSKHDALKEVFNRKKYTDLSIDVFKRRFSFFCLLSYIDEKYEFTQDELLNYIKKSAQIDAVEINADNLVRDLLESVCMMQQDGLDITFTHRSFQEYFTAYCLARMQASKLKLLLNKLSARENDTVFVMMLDMNKDLMEESYVLPTIKKAKLRFKHLNTRSSAIDFAEAFGIRVILEITGRNPRTFQIDMDESEENQFRRLVEDMYPRFFRSCEEKIPKFQEMDSKALKKFPIREMRLQNRAPGRNRIDTRRVNITQSKKTSRLLTEKSLRTTFQCLM